MRQEALLRASWFPLHPGPEGQPLQEYILVQYFEGAAFAALGADEAKQFVGVGAGMHILIPALEGLDSMMDP